MQVRRARKWRWRRPLPWLVLLLAVLLCVLWWFPARWAWPLLRSRVPQVQLQAPSGTVWNGHAAGVSVNGRKLGALDWHLGHAALWGDLAGRVRVQAARWSGYGHFNRSGPQQVDFDHVHATLSASMLGSPPWLRGLRPGGTLQVDIAHLQLRDGWPAQCRGVVQWRHATLSDAQHTAALGDLTADVATQAGTTLQATFADSGGGPLALHGAATATPFGWSLLLVMHTRGHNLVLHRMLAPLGHADADGSIDVQRHAGLFSRRPK